MISNPHAFSHQPELVRGRFAPSPTGPLHFGSLVAAAGSYIEARVQNGQWLVRIEDIDPPREQPGAADAILRTLERFGFEWDGPVWHQSRRTDAYEAALASLRERDFTYACSCSRKQVAQAARAAGSAPGVYPGSCSRRAHPPPGPAAVRLRVADEELCFTDLLQGDLCQQLAREVGDFVLRRADGLFAYQLAVVIDDAAQGITDVVRGCDLLDNTPRQIFLQRRLGLPTPRYLHLPIAVDENGAKLSKQTFAPAIDPGEPAAALWSALQFLGQAPPPALRAANLPTLWEWAFAHWSRAPLAGVRAQRVMPGAIR